MDISKNVTTIIIDLCKKNEITINKLASLTGITQSTIDSILKGKSKNPKIETLLILSDFFSISIDYLIGRTDNPNINK